ncbi:glutamate-5-semialdehyde dehydrogenase [Propionibacterium sp. NM47_B9-13]|jgi:glutamate-5-semialdehyde dehydrogenase|uniref:Gamma-glutamyl phosphate reductase n=2 Tax=Cutibacterium modestum TaxID=2559073 RepID=A0AAD1KPX8_9ACTN|nr:glutamate-5-semialdehyde dehydrogenase [Cutibacterium modestum]TGY29562.1 glutamate-5-semialdehyde dehydrogenase [Propionibacterium sp. NM47_B9-13]AOH44679.1 glutamate-5-semialdehyde dehydrogenase [Cutibacterium modestum]EFS75081.1 glutamate-5-semialdehyde dehydrogenase [Cutibacterium modestum HL037PA2]EFS91790.1 glutamate-5-semialdehyde dehydrogenase [Cutibacterium modestum HL044PA1]EFT15849.1 glutamate-5-semialdehyde dehydrogenase [Cutibacterium modestum HL037PA3]
MAMSSRVIEQAIAARSAATILRRLRHIDKDDLLTAMATGLRTGVDEILAANRADLDRGREAGMDDALLDRLTLTPERIEGMAVGLEEVARLDDPVGEVVRGWCTPLGVKVEQVRVPIGVIGIIYEARPNVTSDAAGICLKSGNACLLRGSSSALESNRTVIMAMRSRLPEEIREAVQLVEGDREVTDELMAARDYVDLLIPRGGAGLINAVVTRAKVPVIQTGTGNCHLVIDVSADVEMAIDIVVNAKTQRPSVCNAIETVLVHRGIADSAVPPLVDAMSDRGVTVHGDDESIRLDSRIVPAAPNEYDNEYLSLDLALRIVDDLEKAVDHIAKHGSGHSETIVTRSMSSQEFFTSSVDAAAVLINCSSRFVDGGEFGFGAEIGISTQKLHARGPMGLREMTTTTYVLHGDGQTRQ